MTAMALAEQPTTFLVVHGIVLPDDTTLTLGPLCLQRITPKWCGAMVRRSRMEMRRFGVCEEAITKKNKVFHHIVHHLKGETCAILRSVDTTTVFDPTRIIEALRAALCFVQPVTDVYDFWVGLEAPPGKTASYFLRVDAEGWNARTSTLWPFIRFELKPGAPSPFLDPHFAIIGQLATTPEDQFTPFELVLWDAMRWLGLALIQPHLGMRTAHLCTCLETLFGQEDETRSNSETYCEYAGRVISSDRKKRANYRKWLLGCYGHRNDILHARAKPQNLPLSPLTWRTTQIFRGIVALVIRKLLLTCSQYHTKDDLLASFRCPPTPVGVTST